MLPSFEMTPDETLEQMREVFRNASPAPTITRPDGALTAEAYAQYRSGELTGATDEQARKTGAWLHQRARALQVSRRRLTGLLWCWRECRAHADDERFVRAFEPLSKALAQFGVGTVPESIAEQRELANTWMPVQRESWGRVA